MGKTCVGRCLDFGCVLIKKKKNFGSSYLERESH